MEERGIDTDRFPPIALMTVMTSVAQILVLEESLGIDAGHAETRALVRRLLDGPVPEAATVGVGPGSAPDASRAAVLSRWSSAISRPGARA